MAQLSLRTLLAFTVVLGAYTVFAIGDRPDKSPNEESRIALTASLLRYGSITLDPVMPENQYGTPFDRSIRLGKSYTDKAPGLSFAGVPIAWLADFVLPRQGTSDLPSWWALRHILVWVLITLPAALFPFVALSGYSGLDEPRRLRFAMVYALVTPMLTYSGVLYSHIPSGLLAVAACVLIIRPGQEDTSVTPWAAALAGLLLAAAVSTEYPTAVVGLVLVPTLILRRASLATLAAFAGGGAVGIVPCLIYHQLAFGSPFATGYAFKVDSWQALLHQVGFMGVTFPTFERLWGVLLSAKRGVLFYCPLLVLIPVGLKRMEAVRKYSSLPFVGLTVVYVLFAAGFVDWQAGWSAAARHLLPWVMISIFPLASALQYLSQQPNLRWIWTAGAAMSLAGALLSVSLSPLFPEHFSSPLGQLSAPMLWQGFAAPTLFASSALWARIYVVAVVDIFISGAVLWALAEEAPPYKTITAAAAIALVYAALIWGTAAPLAPDQALMRNEVLRRMGYGPAYTVQLGDR